MFCVGVNFDLTNITAGLVDKNKNIVLKESVPTLKYRSFEEIIKNLADLIESVVLKAELDINKDIKYVGIGCYGTIDGDKGIMIYSSYFGLKDAHIIEEVKKYIKVPVYIENDANCYALAESSHGSTKGYNNSVIVTLGTAISGGILIDNKIYHGGFYGAGEFGHHVIVLDGEKCDCGRRGCWAAYASSTALVRDARIAAIRHPESEMFKLVNGDIRLMSYRIPFEAEKKGDIYATEVLYMYKRYIALGLINIVNILQPEAIAIGGKMRKVGDDFIDDVAQMVREKTFGQHSGIGTKILLAQMDYDAVIVGAAMLGD